MSLQLHVLFMLYKAKENNKGLSPLVVRITYQKQRKQMATGFFLTPKEWERLQQSRRVKDEKLKQIAAFMETFNAKIQRIANNLDMENRLDLDTLLEMFQNKPKSSLTLLQLFQMHNKELAQRTSLDRAKATYNKYCYTYDKLEQFLKYQLKKNDIAILKLEPSFIQLFYDYLILQCRIAHNTAAKYCKNLKRIMNYGKSKGLLKELPFERFQIGYKDIDRSYLTASELEVLARKSISIKRLELIRDLFLLQCYTGLSFIDLTLLRKEHVVEGIDRRPWLIANRHKTKARYVVPLLKTALDIINRYRTNDNNGDYLLPVISNQKFNAYLKEIGVICGINKSLTSHMGRRTFATTVALGNGITIESIAKMLGHKNTKTTSIYAIVTDMKVSEEMKGLSDKLGA